MAPFSSHPALYASLPPYARKPCPPGSKILPSFRRAMSLRPLRTSSPLTGRVAPLGGKSSEIGESMPQSVVLYVHVHHIVQKLRSEVGAVLPDESAQLLVAFEPLEIGDVALFFFLKNTAPPKISTLPLPTALQI